MCFKKKVQPRRWYIPEEHIEEYYQLRDVIREEGTNLALYEFWKFVYRVVPDAAPSCHTGGYITHPYVEEVLDE